MSNIGIGVIGCGHMGRKVVNAVIQRDERLKVIALHDPHEGSIDQTKKLVGGSPAVCSTYEELISMPDVDWVMIASWNCHHCEQTVAAFEAGKHVFCQKPLATSTEDCIAMFDAWKRSGKSFTIGFSLRYSPLYRDLGKVIADGVVGDIISLEFNETLEFNHGGYIMGDWRRRREYAGTHLLEKCCHDIDLVNWMVGSMAVKVSSFGGLNFFKPKNAHHMEHLGKNERGDNAFQSWPGLHRMNPFTSDKDIFDNQVAILEFANGVRASFHANCCAGIQERRMYIIGTEGAVIADLVTGRIEHKRVGWDTELVVVRDYVTEGHGGGDEVLADELVDTMKNGTPPAASFEEGLKSAITCFAIDEAADTNQVVDVRPYWEQAGVEVM